MCRLLTCVQIVFHYTTHLLVIFHRLISCHVLYCATQLNKWADFDTCGCTPMMFAVALSKQLVQCSSQTVVAVHFTLHHMVCALIKCDNIWFLCGRS